MEEEEKEIEEEEEEEEEEEKDFEVGSILDTKYTLIRKIGEGGFAKIYLVEDLKDKNIYAAKIPLLGTDLSDFENEIKILKKLSQENNNNEYVTKYHESGKGNVTKDNYISEDRHYLISNYISKGNLFAYLMKTKDGFEEKYAKIIFSKILEGVQFIHDSDICHLDLTLDNILLDGHYNPVITDFGLSSEMIKKNDKEYELIKDNLIKGTGCFVCPDMRYYKDGYYGIKADIFSLGVILFYLISKEQCFISTRNSCKTYNLIIKKKYEEYWLIYAHAINKPHILKLSKELKDLFFKLVDYDDKKRPNSVKDIFKEPWLNDIKNFKKEDYIEFENMMKNLENEVEKDNETYENVQIKEDDYNDGTGVKAAQDDEEKIFFDSSLIPKYLNKSGLNAMNYIKIKGKLDPVKFMNSLANKLNKELNCKIENF